MPLKTFNLILFLEHKPAANVFNIFPNLYGFGLYETFTGLHRVIIILRIKSSQGKSVLIW